MNKLRTIITFFQTITIVGVLILVTLIVLSKAGHIIIPSAYVILSGSMEPNIPTGSVAFTLKAPVYSVGDVITFAPDPESNNLVTHRIVDIKRAETYYGDAVYFTKGDRNSDPDSGQISEKAIAGKVVYSVPYVGYIGHWAKSPQGFILFVIVPATIIIYEELKSLVKEMLNAVKRLITKFRGRSPEIASAPRNIHIVLLLVPLLAAGFIGVKVTSSYFFDREMTGGNVFGAAAVFPSPTPTINITPTVTPTPP